MSSSFVIPPELREVTVHVYDHDSYGPRYNDLPALRFRFLVCQTTSLRAIVEGVAQSSRNRYGANWGVGKILDRYGDEFVDPAETVWGALELMPICVMKAPPPVEAPNPPSTPPSQRHQTPSPPQSPAKKQLPNPSTPGPAAGDTSASTDIPGSEAQSVSPQTRRLIGEAETGNSSSPESSESSPTLKIAAARLCSKNRTNAAKMFQTPSRNQENVKRNQAKSTTFTPIKAKGGKKEKVKAKRGRSQQAVGSARELAERARQEREYEAGIDANLRQAQEEAERQASASKLERRANLMCPWFIPPTASYGQ